MNRVYFFGDRSVPGDEHRGHYLYLPVPGRRGAGVGWTGDPFGATPWTGEELDQGLLLAKEQRGRSDERDQTQGLARLCHRNGWTALSLWDRTGDPRGGSNSAIVAEGLHDFDTMVKLFAETFPALWARITGAGPVVSHPSNPRPEPAQLRVPALELRIVDVPADCAIVPGTNYVIELEPEPENAPGEAARRRRSL